MCTLAVKIKFLFRLRRMLIWRKIHAKSTLEDTIASYRELLQQLAVRYYSYM